MKNIILVLISVLFIFSGIQNSKAETFIVDTCNGNYSAGGCEILRFNVQVGVPDCDYSLYYYYLGECVKSTLTTEYSYYNQNTNTWTGYVTQTNKPVTYSIANVLPPTNWVTNNYSVNNTSNPLYIYPFNPYNSQINIPNDPAYIGNFNYILQFNWYNDLALILSITIADVATTTPTAPSIFSK